MLQKIYCSIASHVPAMNYCKSGMVTHHCLIFATAAFCACALSVCVSAFLQVFGATDEDVARLRIVSLFDVDVDKLDNFISNDQQQQQKQQQDSSSDTQGTGSEQGSK